MSPFFFWRHSLWLKPLESVGYKSLSIKNYSFPCYTYLVLFNYILIWCFWLHCLFFCCTIKATIINSGSLQPFMSFQGITRMEEKKRKPVASRDFLISLSKSCPLVFPSFNLSLPQPIISFAISHFDMAKVRYREISLSWDIIVVRNDNELLFIVFSCMLALLCSSFFSSPSSLSFIIFFVPCFLSAFAHFFALKLWN